MTTVAEAREHLFSNYDKGVALRCPCCDRLVKLYRRKFNVGLARSIIWLVRYSTERNPTGDWIHVPKRAPRYVLASREFDKLREWGLAIAKPNKDPAKRASGMWLPTPIGVSFVGMTETIPEALMVYNKAVLSSSPKQINIRTALGRKFDYAELMNERLS